MKRGTKTRARVVENNNPIPEIVYAPSSIIAEVMPNGLPKIAPSLSQSGNVAMIDCLELDPRNPRRGKVETIVESLKSFGQQLPIVLYKFKGSKEYRIIVGNHRTKAAIQLEWKAIAFSIFNGTPEKAQAFALMDNKSSDDAEYDEEILAQVLSEMNQSDDIDMEKETGYSEADLSYLLSRIDLDELDDREIEYGLEQHIKEEEKPLEAEQIDDTIIDYKPRDTIYFTSTNSWDMPPYLENMLAYPPEGLYRTWPGEKYADPNWEGNYFLVWGWTSKGCPYNRSVLGFYTADKQLEALWNNPNKYVQNLVKSQITAVISPDFTIDYNEPKIVRLWNIYRGRWMGRYLQEAGLKLIPNTVCSPRNFDNDVWHMDFPKNLPCVAFQLQTDISRHDSNTVEFHKLCIKQMLKRCSPESIIVYANKFGHEVTQNIFPKQMHIIRVATVQDLRRNKYEPDPLNSLQTSYLTAKQKKRKKSRQRRNPIDKATVTSYTK